VATGRLADSCREAAEEQCEPHIRTASAAQRFKLTITQPSKSEKLQDNYKTLTKGLIWALPEEEEEEEISEIR